MGSFTTFNCLSHAFFASLCSFFCKPAANLLNRKHHPNRSSLLVSVTPRVFDSVPFQARLKPNKGQLYRSGLIVNCLRPKSLPNNDYDYLFGDPSMTI